MAYIALRHRHNGWGWGCVVWWLLFLSAFHVASTLPFCCWQDQALNKHPGVFDTFPCRTSPPKKVKLHGKSHEIPANSSHELFSSNIFLGDSYRLRASPGLFSFPWIKLLGCLSLRLWRFKQHQQKAAPQTWRYLQKMIPKIIQQKNS